MEKFLRFFTSQNWSPFPFQEETWKAYHEEKSGLLHAPTGAGKTYAIMGGPLLEALRELSLVKETPLQVLWITPLRALAGDTANAIRKIIEAVGLNWAVEVRTGDTSSALRARQKRRFPAVLITTPESLSLLLSYADTREKMASLKCAVVDEWHELLGSKRGGSTLQAYPQFSKVKLADGRYEIASKSLGQLHRMSIGTITSDESMALKFLNESYIGQVEESFVAKLKKDETFLFAGKCLQIVRIRDMTAYVRIARSKENAVPRWLGGRLSLSSELAEEILKKLEGARQGIYTDAEMRAVKPILEIQEAWSRLPLPQELLLEEIKVRNGYHLFLYPFAGKLAHEGLSALLAYRLTRLSSRSLAFRTNDYGIVLISHRPFPLEENIWRSLLSSENLLEDILACLNTLELARRQFRDIARIAGLIIKRFPGKSKTARQLQSSSGLLFDVFLRYDPQNLLLDQAKREVLESQLEFSRLKEVLKRIRALSPSGKGGFLG